MQKGAQAAFTAENMRFFSTYSVGLINGIVAVILVIALLRRQMSSARQSPEVSETEDEAVPAARPPLPEVPESTLPPPPPPAPSSPPVASPPYRPFTNEPAEIIMNLDDYQSLTADNKEEKPAKRRQSLRTPKAGTPAVTTRSRRQSLRTPKQVDRLTL